jgi:hypothetical protein
MAKIGRGKTELEHAYEDITEVKDVLEEARNKPRGFGRSGWQSAGTSRRL